VALGAPIVVGTAVAAESVAGTTTRTVGAAASARALAVYAETGAAAAAFANRDAATSAVARPAEAPAAATRLSGSGLHLCASRHDQPATGLFADLRAALDGVGAQGGLDAALVEQLVAQR
jgi:hypothetical protein